MSDNEAFPLAWPQGWPRTRSLSRSRFGNGGVTNYAARQRLLDELRLLGATNAVISSDIPVRRDGLPYSSAKEPLDHGVAVYFRIKGEPRVLAVDKWRSCAENMVAIAKHIEAIRGQLRWGCGSLEQAFGGYRALPEMGAKKPWWEVLGVPSTADLAEVERRRLDLLQLHHPDRGGATGRAAEVNAAYDEARAHLESWLP